MSSDAKKPLRRLNFTQAAPKAAKKKPSTRKGINPSIPPLGEEQKAIVDAVDQGLSFSVDSNPGSGKTTTIFQIASYYPGLVICQITFNKSLKFEVRAKADYYKIPSLESSNVHSYHSFAMKMYGEQLAHSDDGIRLIVETNRPPVHNMGFDVVIIDEVQDKRPLLAVFITKVLHDITMYMGQRPQLILLGDKKQGVYEFLGSRAHFLTHASLIYNEYKFAKYTLTMSYRLTNQVGTFINRVILGKDVIKTDKEGPKVGFITTSNFNKVGLTFSILSAIWKYKKEGNLHDEDILIIAHTLYNNRGMKGNHEVVHMLENKLVEYGHKVYYPSSDETELEQRSMAGRILFATQPQSKGLERKLVVVLDVNGFWCNLLGEHVDKTIAPSSVFVAMSRPSWKLIIVSNDEVPPYFKIPRSALFNTEYSMLEDGQTAIPDKKYTYEKPEIPSVGVVRMCRYLPERLQKELDEMIAPMYKVVAPANKTVIKIPSNIKVTRHYTTSDGVVHVYYTWEYVADKTGNALTHLFDMVYKQEGVNVWLEDQIAEILAQPEGNPHRQLLILNNTSSENSDSVRLANIDDIVSASSIVDHYERNTVSSPTMLNRFDWIKEQQAQLAVARLEKVLGTEVQREVPISCDMELEGNSELTTLTGRIDAISKGTLWEIKCKDKLDVESKLQLIIYSKLWEINFPDNQIKYRLFNIKTGEELELTPNPDIVGEVMDKLASNLNKNAEIEPPEETARQVHDHWSRVKNAKLPA